MCGWWSFWGHLSTQLGSWMDRWLADRRRRQGMKWMNEWVTLWVVGWMNEWSVDDDDRSRKCAKAQQISGLVDPPLWWLRSLRDYICPRDNRQDILDLLSWWDRHSVWCDNGGGRDSVAFKTLTQLICGFGQWKVRLMNFQQWKHSIG